MRISPLLLCFALFACENAPVEAPPEKKTTPEKQKIIASKTPIKKAAGKFDPLEGKSLKEICSATGLVLIKWDYDKLQSDFHSLCCTEGGLSDDDMECSLDWPFSDVPSCNEYDVMRNEIFARYGRAFKSPDWKKAFSEQPWYSIRTEYSDSWLSETANKNVARLVKLKKEKVACID